MAPIRPCSASSRSLRNNAGVSRNEGEIPSDLRHESAGVRPEAGVAEVSSGIERLPLYVEPCDFDVQPIPRPDLASPYGFLIAI